MPKQSNVRSKHRKIKANTLSIRISVDKDIGLHSSVFRVLGCPLNLVFWWGGKERILAISGTDEPTDLSVPVPDYFHRKSCGGAKLKTAGLRRAIKALTGWEDGSTRILMGTYCRELKMVIFKTDTAESGGAL